jgi:chromate reductase, NAD(P)H dehydrogenase (quinone)
VRILLISGSLRRDSHNTKLLRAAAELLPPGTEHELFEGLREIPPFDEDDEASRPPAVEALREAIARADGVLFATPEYNGSLPGQLKNALDWVSRPVATTELRRKPVAVVGASTSLFGAVWAQAELRKVLSTIGAKVVDRELPVMHAQERFDADGLLVEDELRSELAAHVGELAEVVGERAQAVAA